MPSALQEARVRSAEVLRADRPVRRRAHGDPVAQGVPASRHSPSSWPTAKANKEKVYLRLVGPGQRHPSLRHAVPGGDRHAGHHGAVQGRRARHARHQERPGRPSVRPADDHLQRHPVGRTARLRAHRLQAHGLPRRRADR